MNELKARVETQPLFPSLKAIVLGKHVFSSLRVMPDIDNCLLTTNY